MKIIFASNNKNKINQLKLYLENYNILSQKEAGIDIEVEEDGKTFEENAIKKAKAIYDLTHEVVISDDSGLCIDKFNGWPGVITHRFLGEDATTLDRNLFILDKMKELKGDDRKCSVVCDIVVIDKNGVPHTFEGKYNSKIAIQRKGENHFGFDEIVETENGETLACLSEQEKLKINARSIALKKAVKFIKSL